MAIKIKVISDEEKLLYVDTLAQLKVSFFAEYPYLLKLDLDKQIEQFTKILSNPKSSVIVAVDGDKVVGAMPFIDLDEQFAKVEPHERAFQLWFRKSGKESKNYAYLLYIFSLPEYRSKNVNKKMIDAVSKEAKRQGYEGILTMNIVRPSYHAKAPKDFRQSGGFFQKHGFELLPIRNRCERWADDTESKATDKLFELRLRKL